MHSAFQNEVISLSHVTKEFRINVWKKKTAVEDLSLSVPQGQVIGLLGPNGSGKSTTIKMILGFLKPTSGEIRIGTATPEEKSARRQIGYLPENPRFQRFLTASEILNYYGGLHGLAGIARKKRVDELLELVGLAKAKHERVQGFSKGMTQRLAIAQSLLNRPSLLIFDEPMSGLDPLGRMEIRRLIQQVHEEMPASTIFFSSHILEDVEQLCSYVALLRRGKLIHFSPIQDLLLKERGRFQLLVRDVPERLEKTLSQRDSFKKTPLGYVFTVEGSQELVDSLNTLGQNGVTVISLSSQRRSLEEALFSDAVDTPEKPHTKEATL